MQDAVTTPQWEEENSQDFIDYGKYFVPDREIQINCICEVIPPPSESAYILDLCCGEGLLTRALLEKFPESHVYGLDGILDLCCGEGLLTRALLEKFPESHVYGLDGSLT